MTSIGQQAKVKLSKETAQQLSKPPRGTRTDFYGSEIERLISEHGLPSGVAAKTVADANSISEGTARAALYAYRKKQRQPAPMDRAKSPAYAAPRELTDLLDDIAKTTALLSSQGQALVAWSRAQEERMNQIEQEAYASALKKLRAAAENL